MPPNYILHNFPKDLSVFFLKRCLHHNLKRQSQRFSAWCCNVGQHCQDNKLFCIRKLHYLCTLIRKWNKRFFWRPNLFVKTIIICSNMWNCICTCGKFIPLVLIKCVEPVYWYIWWVHPYPQNTIGYVICDVVLLFLTAFLEYTVLNNRKDVVWVSILKLFHVMNFFWYLCSLQSILVHLINFWKRFQPSVVFSGVCTVDPQSCFSVSRSTILPSFSNTEHRNMPLEDALALVSRNFADYMKERRDKPAAAPLGRGGSDTNIHAFLGMLADGKYLSIDELGKVIVYLEERRRRQAEIEGVPLTAPSSAGRTWQSKYVVLLERKSLVIAFIC